MRRVMFSVGLAALVLAAGPASAQIRFDAPVTFDGQRPAPPQVRRPVAAPAPRPKPGVRAYVLFDVESMAASRTFKATTGSARFNAFGGGVEATNIWRRVFIRGAYSKMKKDAERAFVLEGQVIQNGVTGSVEMAPIELAAGWRAVPRAGRGRYAVYGGGGALFLRYKETYTLATSDEITDQTFNGGTVFGGMDVGLGKWIVAGVEAQYRTVPGAIGESETSVSKAFNEKNLGGFALRVLVGFRK